MIFLQLKNDDAILPSHTIESTEKYQYFHAGFRTVHYNPKMNMLDENSIKFCLLHEEGHIRNQYRTGLFLLSLGIILISIIVVVQIFLLLRILLVLSILLISSWLFVLMDEYHCDLYAGRKLQEKYGVSTPSILLEKTLKKLPSSRLSSITHPSIEKRVRNLAENVDKS